MNREKTFQLIGGIDGRFISESIRYMPEEASGTSERIIHMKRKRIVTILLAAVLMLALGITAYAVWNVHTAKQQELKEDLHIEESNTTSYVEFAVPEEGQGLVLLSTVNDGQEQHVFLNLSPVTEEEAASFPSDMRLFWSIEGTEYGGFAAPQLPVNISLSGDEEIRNAVLEHAYDKETKTLTVQCWLENKMVKKAMTELGTFTVPLQVSLAIGENEPRTYGPVDFALTEEQLRSFDFGNAVYHDPELDRDIEILGLELSPFSAVWTVHYEGDAGFHTPEADWDAYQPWSMLEDKVCIETQILFSDGSSFSTGGAVSAPYENEAVHLQCGWGKAIDISAVEKIVLGDLVLWEEN